MFQAVPWRHRSCGRTRCVGPAGLCVVVPARSFSRTSGKGVTCPAGSPTSAYRCWESLQHTTTQPSENFSRRHPSKSTNIPQRLSLDCISWAHADCLPLKDRSTSHYKHHYSLRKALRPRWKFKVNNNCTIVNIHLKQEENKYRFHQLPFFVSPSQQ